MLPKLAKRISSSKSNNLNNGNESPTRLHSPTRPEIQRKVSTRDDNNDVIIICSATRDIFVIYMLFLRLKEDNQRVNRGVEALLTNLQLIYPLKSKNFVTETLNQIIILLRK